VSSSKFIPLAINFHFTGVRARVGLQCILLLVKILTESSKTVAVSSEKYLTKYFQYYILNFRVAIFFVIVPFLKAA